MEQAVAYTHYRVMRSGETWIPVQELLDVLTDDNLVKPVGELADVHSIDLVKTVREQADVHGIETAELVARTGATSFAGFEQKQGYKWLLSTHLRDIST